MNNKKLLLFIASATLVFSSAANANATGEQVIAGQANFQRIGNDLFITQGSQRVIINWQDFSNNVGELTEFIQPNSSAAALNRVVSGNLSSLLGELKANGQIYLVNPNGIVVGADAQINTQSFIASTLDVSNSEFMNGGDMNFVGDSEASIVNLGKIETQGGDVFLIAKHVDNNGTINAEQVGLAGGNDVLLKASGDDRIAVRVTDKDGRIDQTGLIEATKIELRTAGNNPYALAINHEGISRATSAVNKKGRIILFAEGGTTKVDGTLDASAPESGDGGFVETSGTHVKIADNVNIDTSANNGVTGTWLIDPNDFTIAATGGDLSGTTLATQLDSNNVEIQTATQGTPGGNGDIFVNDTVTWTTDTNLTLTAERNINVNSDITAGGDVTLQAGNGVHGASGASPGAVGGTGAKGGDIVIDAAIASSQGNIIARAGHGGNGGNGAAGVDDFQRGGSGGTGGDGGDITTTANGTLTANQGAVTLVAGNSGSGGVGGSGSQVSDKANVGGFGGHAGTFAGDVNINASIVARDNISVASGYAGSGGHAGFTSNFIRSQGFEGSDGGNGGYGGSVAITDTLTSNNGLIEVLAGHGGVGGRGGNATVVHAQKTVNTSIGILLTSPNADDGGDGGDGGRGGSISLTATLNSAAAVTLRAGNSGTGGAGGFGGNAGASISSASISGSGGNGGNGGFANQGGSITTSGNILANGDVAITAGHAGNGGYGGRGGDGANGLGEGGHGGHGGLGNYGGLGGSVTINNSVSTTNGALTISAGNGGNGGEGGYGVKAGLGDIGGNGGRGGYGGGGQQGGNVAINADISFTETGLISAGHGGVGANAGRGGVGGIGSSGSSITDAFGGNGGNGGNGGEGADGGKVDINANITGSNNTLTIRSGNAGTGGAGGTAGAGGGVYLFTSGAGSTPGVAGTAGANGTTGNAADIEVGGTITNTDGDIVMQSARDLLIQSGAAVTSLGLGNQALAASRNFHNDSGSVNPLSVNSGRYLVYSSRPDQNNNDLEMNNDFVRYGTNFNPGDPDPMTFPDGNGLIYSANLTANVTANNQTITYGNNINETDFSLSNILLEGGAVSAAAVGLDNNSSLVVELDGVSASTSGFAIAGNHVSGLNINNQSGISLAITKGDLTVNQRTLNATLTADNKVYDANTVATGSYGDDRVATDVFTINDTGINFSDKNVANGKTVTADGLSLTGVDSVNYVLAATTINDTADITPASLTIIANDAEKEFDTTPFDGGNGVNYVGFVGSENESELTGVLAYTGNSQGAVDPGTYIITPEGLVSTNYDISFVNGKLSINAVLTNNTQGSPGNTFGSFQSQNNNNSNTPKPFAKNDGTYKTPPGFQFGNKGGNNIGANSPFPLRVGGSGTPPSFSHASSFDNQDDDQ